MGQLASMLGPSCATGRGSSARRAAQSLPFHLIIADSVAAEPGAELAGVDGVLLIDVAGTCALGDPAHAAAAG